MNILLIFTLLTVSPSAAQRTRTHDNVYCNHTVLKDTGTLSVQQCKELCLRKANLCKSETGSPHTGTTVGSIPVDVSCFNIKHEDLSPNCIFSFQANVKADMQVASGITKIRSRARKTVTFTRVQKPVVFAQVLTGIDNPQHGNIVVHDIQETAAVLGVESVANIDDDTEYDGEFYVAWFVIGEDNMFKDFGSYHVHLVKENLKGPGYHNVVVKKNPKTTGKWPSNIALFAQSQAPNIDITAKLTVGEQININITAKNNDRETLTSGRRAPMDVALLLVDLDHFKDGNVVEFGNMAITSPITKFDGGMLNLNVAELKQPLVFFTPYYNRSHEQHPRATCWSDGSTKESINFKCKVEPETMVTPPYSGKINVAFLAVEKMSEDDQKLYLRFQYNQCATAYATANATSDSEPILRTKPEDMLCKDRCFQYRAPCNGNVNCIQSYLGGKCSIEGVKYMKHEQKQKSHIFMDAIRLLNFEIRGAVCTGMYDAVSIDNVMERHSDWAGAAMDICVHNQQRDKVMVVIDEHVSFNFCEAHMGMRVQLKWQPLSELKDQYTKDGKPLPLKEVFKDKIVYGICQYQDKVEIKQYHPYPETVYEEDDLEPTNADCVESQWEEWGSCSLDCIPENGEVVKKRSRYIIRPAYGSGKKCVTEETKQCTLKELPSCNEVCLITQWTDWGHCINYQRKRERYVMHYSKVCDSMVLTETQVCVVNDVLPGWDDEDDVDGQDYDASMPLHRLGIHDADTRFKRKRSRPAAYPTRRRHSSSSSDGEEEMEDEDEDEKEEEEEEEEEEEGEEEYVDASDTFDDASAGEETEDLYSAFKDIEDDSMHDESDDRSKQQTDCLLWSEWSGCSTACDDTIGHQYRISSTCDAHNTYELNRNVQSRRCTATNQCEIGGKINCLDVRSVFYSEADDQTCREECTQLLQICKDNEEVNETLCFARLKAESAEAGGFFFKCMFPEERESTIALMHSLFKNKCFLSKAIYSTTDNSWVNKNTQSCHCAIPGSIPCTAKDIHITRNDIYKDLIESGFCPTMNYKQGLFNLKKGSTAPDSLTYVSLANNNRLHCPLGINEEVFTYTEFKGEELKDYCQRGPIYAALKPTVTQPVTQYSHNYDCNTAVSTGNASNMECVNLCKTLRTRCLSYQEKYFQCIKQRLTLDFQYESDLFTTYNCRLPPTLDAYFDVDYYAFYISTFDSEHMDKKACTILVQNAILQCEADELLENNNSFIWCMASALGDLEPTTQASPKSPFETQPLAASRFKEKCKFQPSLKAGSGYVMCRFPAEMPTYANWDEWSPCTAQCNEFDSVATRYRTRKLIDGKETAFYQIEDGTLQFEMCLHLPGCEKGRWVDSLNDGDGKIHILDHEAYKDTSSETTNIWLEQTYMQHPELRNAVGKNAKCHIFKSHKILSSKGVTCGCPRGHKACSFTTAMTDQLWKMGMHNFCRDRPLASIRFEGETSDYVYHCKIGMLLKHTAESGALGCDYYDNNEYVACEETESKPLILRSKHFTLMGVCLGIVFCLYTTIRHILKKRRIRINEQKKDE